MCVSRTLRGGIMKGTARASSASLLHAGIVAHSGAVTTLAASAVLERMSSDIALSQSASYRPPSSADNTCDAP